MSVVLANWNGTIMPLADVRVSVLDRAFLFGDAVYEAMRVYSGRVFHLDRHFSRLRRSLDELRLHCDTERLRDRVLATLDQSGTRDGLVYIQVTRGAASTRTHALPDASVPSNELAWIHPYASSDPYEPVRSIGVAVVTYSDLRWRRRDIKTVNLLGNCLAAQAAKEADAYDALLINEAGDVTEGSHTSAFAVRGGKILTSPLGPHILPGVTRHYALELAQSLGIAIEEHPFRAVDISTFDEIFLTGTSTEVLGVRIVDGGAVGNGGVGPITARLSQAYKDSIRAWLKSEESA